MSMSAKLHPLHGSLCKLHHMSGVEDMKILDGLQISNEVSSIDGSLGESELNAFVQEALSNTATTTDATSDDIKDFFASFQHPSDAAQKQQGDSGSITKVIWPTPGSTTKVVRPTPSSTTKIGRPRPTPEGSSDASEQQQDTAPTMPEPMHAQATISSGPLLSPRRETAWAVILVVTFILLRV